jgi:hypothetical protein
MKNFYLILMFAFSLNAWAAPLPGGDSCAVKIFTPTMAYELCDDAIYEAEIHGTHVRKITASKWYELKIKMIVPDFDFKPEPKSKFPDSACAFSFKLGAESFIRCEGHSYKMVDGKYVAITSAEWNQNVYRIPAEKESEDVDGVTKRNQKFQVLIFRKI